MIQADEFIGLARSLGFKTWAGVPCSFLTPFINRVISDDEMTYISSANEGDAVATATGAALAGQPAVAMMQNSGLGNAVSPLSSLNWIFRIPILLIVTLRGEPGLGDEPQHELMGQITAGILEQLDIAWQWFPRESSEITASLQAASLHMNKTARPFAFIMRKGSVKPSSLSSEWVSPARPTLPESGFENDSAARLTRQEVLQAVFESTADEKSMVIGTTGYTGRELFAIGDRPNHLYMVGSMGCASSFGLGVAIARPDQAVYILDGDGAALMRMGNFATVGAYGGKNLHHLLLDNGVHESTGGQQTVSAGVNFASIASACGYRSAAAGVDLTDVKRFLADAAGPNLLHFRTRRGVPTGLPRPDVTPVQVRARFMSHFGITTEWSALHSG